MGLKYQSEPFYFAHGNTGGEYYAIPEGVDADETADGIEAEMPEDWHQIGIGLDETEAERALAVLLECEDPSDGPNVEVDGDRVTVGRREYLVLTDSEADAAWDSELERYIEDCILPEIPEMYRGYFDEDKWKADARVDGRGHSLAGYDGEECEARINGTDYFIYRQN